MERVTAINRSKGMESCINDCLETHSVCSETINHCLQKGGEHASVDHIRVMMDCSEMCSLNADLMLRNSILSSEACTLCAMACEMCANSCDVFRGDLVMQKCAETCRRTAESCRGMTGQQKLAYA